MRNIHNPNAKIEYYATKTGPSWPVGPRVIRDLLVFLDRPHQSIEITSDATAVRTHSSASITCGLPLPIYIRSILDLDKKLATEKGPCGPNSGHTKGGFR